MLEQRFNAAEPGLKRKNEAKLRDRLRGGSLLATSSLAAAPVIRGDPASTRSGRHEPVIRLPSPHRLRRGALDREKEVSTKL